eukprot:gene5673-6858_t
MLNYRSVTLQMLIKGIRAFSPDNQNVIEFFRPLTLIVGENGAGKTTIIECLKMACTGDLPPNVRSGQSFIHDPKVSGETEVKAQIKMRFNNQLGRPVVTIRSFSLTQKASKQEFKTLDSTLSTTNPITGEHEAITNRCADMGKEVPALMGVSKAVLENVIFVHQDESNWPLAEGATLKKKFDDIFSATRYTKALEAIRKLKTEQAQEIKENKLKIDTLQKDIDLAVRLRESIKEDQTKADVLKGTMEQASNSQKKLQEELKTLTLKSRNMHEMSNCLKVLEAQLESKMKENSRLFDQMDVELEEPLEELLKHQRECEAEYEERHRRSSEAADKITRKKMDAEGVKRAISEDLARESKLKAEAEMHQQSLKGRRDFSRRMAEAHTELGAEAPETDPAVDNFQQKVVEYAAGQAETMQAMKQVHRAEEDRYSNLVAQAAGELNQVEQSCSSNTTELDRYVAQTEEKRRRQAMLHVTEGALAESEKQLADAQQHVRKEKETLESEELAAKISAARGKMDGLDRKIFDLNRDRDQLSVASEDMQRLRLMKEQQTKKTSECQQILDTKRNAITDFVGEEALNAPAQLGVATRQALQGLEGRLKQQNARVQEKGNELSGVEAKLHDAGQRKRQLEQQRDTIKRQLVGAVQGILDLEQVESGTVSWSTTLESTQQTLDKQRTSNDSYNAMSKIFSDFVKRGKDPAQNCCPVCTRKWKDRTEMDTFVRTYEDRMKNDGAKKAENEKAVSAIKSRLGQLQKMQPSYLKYEDVKSELQKMEELVIRLQEDETKLTDMMDSLSAETLEIESLKQKGTKVVKDVESIERLQQEMAQLARDVSYREERMPSLEGSTRSIQELNEEMAQLERDRKGLGTEREHLEGRLKQLENAVRWAETKHRDMREEYLKAEQRQKEFNQLTEAIAEAESWAVKLRGDIAAAKEKVAPLREQKAKHESAREAARK